jgi:molybdenum cofactor guanylyltransferase
MTLNKHNITAVILAGGRGSRLGGQDKGLVNYKDKALIEHVLERIKPQVGAILINANRNINTYEKYGYPVINDELSDFQGPLAGFASAMKTVKTSHIITLPCDGPKLPRHLVKRLLKSLDHQTNAIAVAHDGKRMQPVHALIPVTLVKSLEAFLAAGDRKIDLWYDQQKVVIADFSDQPSAFSNINTAAQHESMSKQ